MRPCFCSKLSEGQALTRGNHLSSEILAIGYFHTDHALFVRFEFGGDEWREKKEQ